MNNLKSNKYISLVVFIAIIAGSLAFIWLFLFSQLSDAQNQYISNSRLLSELNQKADFKNELKKELEDIQEEIDLINSALLTEGNQVDFIQSVEEIANNNQGVYSVKGIREIVDPKSDKLQEIELTISIIGQFDNVINFFEEIKDEDYLVNIKNLNITTEELGVVNATSTISVYIK